MSWAEAGAARTIRKTGARRSGRRVTQLGIHHHPAEGTRGTGVATGRGAASCSRGVAAPAPSTGKDGASGHDVWGNELAGAVVTLTRAGGPGRIRGTAAQIGSAHA